MKRDRSLDYAKGISIILLLYMHCGNPTDNYFKIIISSFFMVIFFLICGILIYLKYPKGIRRTEVSKYIEKRSKQVLMPYFSFGSILILFFQGLHIIAGESLDLLKMIVKLITFQGIESMWFLPCYLFAEILFVLVLLKLEKKFRFLITSIFILFIVFLNLDQVSNIVLYRKIVLINIGVVLIYIGCLIAKYNLISEISMTTCLILSLICSYLAIKNGFIGLSNLDLSNTILFFFNGIGLSCVILFLCKWIEKYRIPLLERFGQNTIVVLCTNNLFIEIIRLVDYKFAGNFLIQKGAIGDIIFTAIMVLVEYVVIVICDHKLWFLFGRGRKK